MGGVGITSGRDSLCGTKPSGGYDISLHWPLLKKKEEDSKTGKNIEWTV